MRGLLGLLLGRSERSEGGWKGGGGRREERGMQVMEWFWRIGFVRGEEWRLKGVCFWERVCAKIGKV